MPNRRVAFGSLLAAGSAALCPLPGMTAACTAPVDRARFEQYLKFFAAYDPKFLDFYAEDVVLSIGARGDIRGPRAIYDFYGKLRENFIETMELLFYCADEAGTCAEIQGSYVCIKDVENSEIFNRSIKKGEVRRHRGVVLYTLAKGKFKWIRGTSPTVTADWHMEN